MDLLPDGYIVAAARARLADEGVCGEEGWRSTVVPAPDSGWTVRTWTQTPSDAARPSGQPDYVHRVVLTEDGQLHRVDQVHPASA